MFYWVLVHIYTSYLPKKCVCSVLNEVLRFSVFSSIYFLKNVNKAIVTTQDPYTIQTFNVFTVSYLQKNGAKLLSQVTEG